jgi:hypothetical protein
VRRASLLAPLLLFCASCASAPKCPTTVARPRPKPVIRDQLSDAERDIEELVLTTYARLLIDAEESATPVQVQVPAASSNFDEEPALTAFVQEQIAGYLRNQIKLSVQPELTAAVEGVLEQHIIATRDAAGHVTELHLLALLKEAKTGRALASATLPITRVPQTQAYLAYEQQHANDAQGPAYARLRIQAINVGKRYEALERVSQTEDHESKTGSAQVTGSGGYQHNDQANHGSGSANVSATQSTTTSRESYQSFGTSGWYPMEQQVQLNGASYKQDRDGLFLDQVVPPGSYQGLVSFRIGFWDAVSQSQVVGKKIARAFSLNVERGQNRHVNIVFVCDETHRDIRIESD